MAAYHSGRSVILIRGISFIGILLAIASSPVSAQRIALKENAWTPNGRVDAIASTEDAVYIGGEFNYIGLSTGGWAPISLSTGKIPSSFPKVNGIVAACVDDGSGGFFIGGEFTRVGAEARMNFAHILPDGSLDMNNTSLTGYFPKTTALARSGFILYIACELEGGEPLSVIYLLDLENSKWLSWSPKVNGIIRAMAVSDSGQIVYIGGDFTLVQGKLRKYLVALNLSSDQPEAWDPMANDSVYSLALSGSTIYAGGKFTSIGGQPRDRIAAIDTSSSQARDWNPGVSKPGSPAAECHVDTLLLSGSVIYAGGSFSKIGGEQRANIAALDTNGVGSATPWNPGSNGPVYVLSVSGSTIYAGGDFASIGGQSRLRLAALSMENGLANDWNPNMGGPVLTMGFSGSYLYAGGNFVSIGGLTRNNLAAFDIAGGNPLDWNPNANGAVNVLARSGNTIFAGGKFTKIGSETRNRLAAIDASSGIPAAWNPDVQSVGTEVNINALAMSGSTLYVGGAFTTVGLLARNHIAAIDLATGLPTSWNPDPLDGQVRALALSGSTLYLGGWFVHVGSLSRKNIAALDTVTAAAATWDPSADHPVNALALSGSTLYVGGFFNSIGGETRYKIAAISTETGLATPWAPNAEGNVNAIAVSNSAGRSLIYVGGDFGGGQLRPSFLAAYDAKSGFATKWDPKPNGYVNKIVLAGSDGAETIFVGGEFRNIGNQMIPYFAQFDLLPLGTQDWLYYR